MEAVTADLWRRAKRWDEVQRAVDHGLKVGAAVIVKTVLELKMEPIKRHDATCHTMAAINKGSAGEF